MNSFPPAAGPVLHTCRLALLGGGGGSESLADFFFFQPLEGDADLKPGLGFFSPLSPLLPVCMTTSANVVNVGSALACVDFLSSRFPCC